jgi:peroxiredoxin
MARNRSMLEAGKSAPDFLLVNNDGKFVGRSELGGELPVLLAFYKTSCPTCQLTLPFLERLHRQATGQLQVYAVSQDTQKTTSDFLSYFRLTIPSLLDRAQDGYPASNAFGITHVPSMFMVEPDGTISWADNGFQRDTLAALARRFGVTLFEANDDVPDWRPG